MQAWGWAAAAVMALTGGATLAATPCANLMAAKLDHTTVAAAADARAGELTACRVEVISRPTPDSEIRIEVWIPEGAAWNGRYVQLGNGGFAGAIRAGALEAYAAQGYAVAMTDDGHQAEGTDGRWAIGHPEKVRDFGWRALKETTRNAKALIGLVQGGRPSYAYFVGCSDGGREALMEAQRFPEDFNGIVAGAPAYNFSRLLTLAATDAQALSKPGGYLDVDALKTLETGALKACAGGGPYVRDPARCHFDPASVACRPGQSGPGCLSAGQVATARAIYEGLEDYRGHSPGAEAEAGSWATWTTGPSADHLSQALSNKFATGFWGGFVYGDGAYDVTRLDLARAKGAAAKVAAEVDSTDPDLTRFRAHGGKLIHYHGWNDPAIPAVGSIAYYEDVRAHMGDVDDFYRLYLVPGMLHCGGGPGPGVADWLGALRSWVEKGEAPRLLTASTTPGKSPPAQQSLCPYPAIPVNLERAGGKSSQMCATLKGRPSR